MPARAVVPAFIQVLLHPVPTNGAMLARRGSPDILTDDLRRSFFRYRLRQRGRGRNFILIPCDFEMYKWRHLVENFCCTIKEFRRIVTRYDKTDTSFAA